MRKIDQDFSAVAGNAQRALQQARSCAERAEHLNALAYVDWPVALKRARESDEQAVARLASGQPLGPLHGVPVTVKDLYQVDGMPMRAGTRAALPPSISQGPQALAVSRLEAAGALIFAKTNMHEIALGATGENAWTGDVCNPFDPRHQAGGSSSGAAVAVASDIGMLGLGSDTGGSVRIPAAFCGVVGFKPSFGKIPLDGALHLSWTCDHAGPITRTVSQARIAYEVMAGIAPETSAQPRPASLRVGLLPSWEQARLSETVSADFAGVLTRLRQSGVQLVPLELSDSMKTAWEVYSTIVRAEAAWVHRAVLADTIQAEAGFSASVLSPLRSGLTFGAQQYLDAMQRRETARAQIDAALESVDVVITPTTAVYPPLRGQDTVDLSAGHSMSVREAVLGQTLAFSLFGLPVLSLPYAQTKAARGFPLGLQILASRGADSRVLACAQLFEQMLA